MSQHTTCALLNPHQCQHHQVLLNPHQPHQHQQRMHVMILSIKFTKTLKASRVRAKPSYGPMARVRDPQLRTVDSANSLVSLVKTVVVNCVLKQELMSVGGVKRLMHTRAVLSSFYTRLIIGQLNQTRLLLKSTERASTCR